MIMMVSHVPVVMIILHTKDVIANIYHGYVMIVASEEGLTQMVSPRRCGGCAQVEGREPKTQAKDLRYTPLVHCTPTSNAAHPSASAGRV